MMSGWRLVPSFSSDTFHVGGSFEYIEYAVADSRQGVALQLESWARG
jgi:hypothetical protein